MLNGRRSLKAGNDKPIPGIKELPKSKNDRSNDNLLNKDIETPVTPNDLEVICKFHMQNQVHILCQTCSEMICDKCLIDEHSNHVTEDFKMAQSNDFVINIMTNFYSVMKKNNEEHIRNFKDKIYENEKMINSFFEVEMTRVEKTTGDLIEIIKNLNGKVKKLIMMYQQKLKEDFFIIKEDYEKFQEEILNLQSKLNQFKSNKVKGAARFKEFKEFKVKKITLEFDFKRLQGFYDFNKSALISEFSMKNFYSFLDKTKIFLTKHNDEYSKLTQSLNVNEKINSVIGFDESKMLFASKNFLPRSISKIYQPVDRTNAIIIYDSETEKFKKMNLFPRRLAGFSFFPFCRYINFNGRLFVSGGYEDSKLSRTFWAIEDKNNFEWCDTSNTTSDGKYSGNTSNINLEFYSNVNDKSYVYEDENQSNFSIIRCSNMIHSRAGHAMVGLSPSLILAFAGTEGNKTCELFHFDSNRWEEISSLNVPRIDPSAFIYKNAVYVFFGLKYDKVTKKFSFLDTIEKIPLLNMQNAEWEYVIPKFTGTFSKDILPRSMCGIVVKGNSSVIYLCGGQVDKDKYSNDIFEYNIDFNTLALCEKKLPKPSAFLEQNFLYLFKTGINFDMYGDVFYYNNNDTFNFTFQKLV